MIGHQYHCLVLEKATQAMLEETLSNLRVHCTQRVVQEVSVGVSVAGSGQGETGSLASGDVEASLPHQGVDPLWKLSHIWLQLTHLDHSP